MVLCVPGSRPWLAARGPLSGHLMLQTPNTLLAKTAPLTPDNRPIASSPRSGTTRASKSCSVMGSTPTCSCWVRCPLHRHTRHVRTEHYGFVLPGNPHDTAVLSMPDGRTVTLHWNGVPTWESLRDLRLAALGPGRRDRAHRAHCGERVSAANDAAALRALNVAASMALAAMPTTLKDDLAELARVEGDCGAALVCQEGVGEVEADVCALLALQWRVGHKRMLYWASMLCLQGQVDE